MADHASSASASAATSDAEHAPAPLGRAGVAVGVIERERSTAIAFWARGARTRGLEFAHSDYADRSHGQDLVGRLVGTGQTRGWMFGLLSIPAVVSEAQTWAQSNGDVDEPDPKREERIGLQVEHPGGGQPDRPVHRPGGGSSGTA